MEKNKDTQSISIEKIFSLNSITALESDSLLSHLSNYINELILNNFELLIQLLYRIDVSESKLKKLLLENQNEDASKMIAALIIERQIQKIKSTKDQDNQKVDACTEERW
jgi:hypothetical protein